MTDAVKPKMWAVVEIMGHKRIAGEVSEEVKFGVPMMRVDVPKTSTREAFVRFFGGSSIHSFTPMDETSVRRAAEWLDESPSILPGVIESPMLAGKSTRFEDDYGFAGSDDDGSDYDDEPDYDDDPDDDEDETEAIVPAPNPLKSIVSMERGETSGSKSPMWRCITFDDQKVNVFKHEKPERDTFHLFQEAGYGPLMEQMKIGEVLTWKQCPISVTMSKKGDWWEVTRVYQMSPEDKPEVGRDDDKSKAAAAQWAKALIESDDWVLLDTETTGLNRAIDEPVSVCIVHGDGTVLLDVLVNASQPIDPEASAVHGITEEKLKNEPTFARVKDDINAALRGKQVVVYNLDFDSAMLINADNVMLEDDKPPTTLINFEAKNWQCAMERYAEFYGEWNPHHANYKNQSLSKACEQQGITDIEAPAHSALGDCLRTLALIKKMAAYDPHPF